MRGIDLVRILRNPRSAYECWRLRGKQFALDSIRNYIRTLREFADRPDEWWDRLETWTGEALRNYGPKCALPEYPFHPHRSDVMQSGARAMLECFNRVVRDYHDRLPTEPARRRDFLLRELKRAVRVSNELLPI